MSFQNVCEKPRHETGGCTANFFDALDSESHAMVWPNQSTFPIVSAPSSTTISLVRSAPSYTLSSIAPVRNPLESLLDTPDLCRARHLPQRVQLRQQAASKRKKRCTVICGAKLIKFFLQYQVFSRSKLNLQFQGSNRLLPPTLIGTRNKSIRRDAVRGKGSGWD